jgi:hypothetical protein
LPDHLAARFPGPLQELEDVVSAAEGAKGLEKLADRLRPDGVSLPSALRWIMRRVRLLHRLFAVLIGLIPEQLAGCPPTVQAFRQRLCCEWVLVTLRANAALPLASLPRPLGFAPRRRAGGEADQPFQHHLGPDPPPARR